MKMYHGGIAPLATLLQLLASMRNGAGSECFGKTNAIFKVADGHKEYRLFNTKATHSEAIQKCRDWGRTWKSLGRIGRLASIPESTVHKCLTNMIMTEGNFQPSEWREDRRHVGYFVGGTATRAEWLWPDGGQISLSHQNKGFQRWGENEPRGNNAGKRCMAMIMQGSEEVGTWVEQPCEEESYYICERDIPKHRVWGFERDAHSTPPHKWSSIKKDYEICDGQRQSPVDLRASGNEPPCKGHDGNNLVSYENSTDVYWRIENTGRMVKITTEYPGSVYAVFSGSTKRHYVDYMLLKWGANSESGSEHTVQGLRHAGELQVFHRAIENGERYALSFMIHERPFQDNENWSQLLSYISLIQEPDTFVSMEAPVDNIMTLLTDSVSTARFSSPESKLQKGIRYKGSLPHPPCTQNVIWTVYSRPINLSFGQLYALRHTNMEGRQGNNRRRKMNGNHRPIQTQDPDFVRNNPHCIVHT